MYNFHHLELYIFVYFLIGSHSQQCSWLTPCFMLSGWSIFTWDLGLVQPLNYWILKHSHHLYFYIHEMHCLLQPFKNDNCSEVLVLVQKHHIYRIISRRCSLQNVSKACSCCKIYYHVIPLVWSNNRFNEYISFCI